MPFKDYRRTSSYGWRIHPIDKVRKFHAGIDLVKLKGGVNANVEAFVGGQVLYAGNGVSGTGVGGYGNVVVIRDNKGAAHLYAHLHSVAVKTGQTVKAGQVIGKQGATGNVTGAHLHYEVRKKSSPSLGWTNKPESSTVDPTQYLNNYKGSDRVVRKLVVDGKRGQKTIDRWQQFLGTTRDGKISKPSQLIMAWQTFLNKYGGAKLKVDGYEGTKTIRATQKFFGTPQDGVISDTSLMVKALQQFLNNYGQ